ncbi:MAG: carbohydrate porin [Verrucomicrobia bacterium]|nr:carbohydrate porin [Verrucomicrobiota bacterium]
MPSTHFLLTGLCGAALVTGLSAGPEYAWGTGKLALGAEATLDAASGLSGQGAGRESLFGTVLGHALWTQTVEPAQAKEVTWSACTSVLWVEGRGPTERILGDFLAADNAEACQSLRLYSWWAEATGATWSWRSGALLADEEFCGTTAGGALINSAFGWPAFISGNVVNTGPAYYAAALGSRVALTLPRGWIAKVGVYDGDAFDSAVGDEHPNRHGTHYQLNADQGAVIFTELGYAPEGAPTRAYAGGWLHTADFADLGSGETHAGNHGAYAVIERTLAGKTGEAGNVEAHVRYGWAPEDRSTVAWAFDAAVAATGLLPSRPADVTALGFVYAEMSAKLAGQDFEQVTELSHSIALGDHLTVQPDLQYIRHVGAVSTASDAWLFSLRLSATY